MKKYKILSIDGGGIRGLLPAMILQEMEKRLRVRTGNPQARIADYFDIIAGTSAGGMLACSMLYKHDGKKMDCSTAVSFLRAVARESSKRTASTNFDGCLIPCILQKTLKRC